MLDAQLDRKKVHSALDLSISKLLEELSHKFAPLWIDVCTDSKPRRMFAVALVSGAKENLESKFNKFKNYFQDRSDIFKSSALTWSTLSHHNSRGRL